MITKPSPEDLAAAKSRLEYFEAMLAEWESKPDGDEGKAWRVKYYRQEVGERRMLWALWEHLLGQ